MSLYLAHPSPHVKSGMFMGQMKSIWRAMNSPVFDFQGDLHQQGGAIIAGPGKHSLLNNICPPSPTLTSFLQSFSAGAQVHFCHFDTNRIDHMPINWLLQLAGVQKTVDFSSKPKIINV